MMKEMFISKFKATYLAILNWVKKARNLIGQPAGDMRRPSGNPARPLPGELGSMRSTARIVGFCPYRIDSPELAA
jgi:hypothetical protein